MKKDIYDFYRERMEHDDHMHIEVRDGTGIVRGEFLHREPFVTTFPYEKCEWCGFFPYDKVVAEHPELGVAYFPYDDAIHCIMPEHCRRRLMFRLGLLLGEVLYVKRERSDTFLSALLPE